MIRSRNKLLKSVILLFFGVLVISNTFAVQVKDYIIYDLTYTSRGDFSNTTQVNNTWDHCHAVATLQGIVNREKPNLYLKYVDSQHSDLNVDAYWLSKISQKGQWLGEAECRQIKDFTGLFEYFKRYINGLVVYDPAVAATSNVASAVAGAENLVAVRFDQSKGSAYSILTKEIGLPVKVWLVNPDGSSLFTKEGKISGTGRYTTGSSKCDAYIWMKEHYLKNGKLNSEYAAYYIDYFWATNPTRIPVNHHNLTNHDFFVSRKGWFFDLDPWADEAATDDPGQIPGTDRRVLKELLMCAYHQVDGKKMIHVGGFPPWAHKYTQSAGFRHGDVSTEWEYCMLISAYNAFKDADAISYGAMANGSFWQHFPLKQSYPQNWVTRKELQERGYLTNDGKVDFRGRQFIIFYVGDYDAASWLYQRTMDIWDDPNRGKVPLMWCFSPILSVRAPMAMDYVRRTATKNDYFAAADNGAGYVNPGALQYPGWSTPERPISGLPSGLSVWQKHCKKYYEQWGLTITGFVIDGYAEGMGLPELDCYQGFSPNGLVWAKGAVTYLHKNMPVIRSDHDINESSASKAADHVIERVRERSIPFHWFRNILKSPTWYVQVHAELNKKAPEIELLDAPTFFELFRIYLQNSPDAAVGKYPYF